MHFHKPAFKTKIKYNTLNPEWNEETKIELQTGAFEKRTAHRWQMDVTKRQQRQHQAEEAMAVLRDQDDVRVHFGDDRQSHHGVKVYLGDTIHQFRQKLRLACHLEAAALEHEQGQANQTRREKLVAVAKNMSNRHTVMVFVPSPRLRELALQQRHRQLYKIEENDPSNWQPLDSTCTFSHYATQYGFGMQLSPRLRISANDDKQKNNRHRHFADEQDRWSKHLQDLNTESECFGYAHYTHSQDGGSTEWRPAIIDRPEQSNDAQMRFKALFVYAPSGLNDSVPANISQTEQSIKRELDEDKVLLAPSAPRILASDSLLHQELLAKAKQLHDDNMNENDILSQLNAELLDNWKKTREAMQNEGNTHTSKPPQITLIDVQQAIKRGD